MSDGRAVAMGDQMYAAMFETAKRNVGAALATEDLRPTDADWDYIEIGIGAGTHAAMRVLVDMGLLPVVEQ